MGSTASWARQDLTITSGFPGGVGYTATSANVPAWLDFSEKGTAQTTPHTHTIAVHTGCGGFALGSSNTATIHLVNAPWNDKLLTVTLRIVSPSALSVVSPASMKYTQKSGTPGALDVNVGSLP